jgi:hypothetical protein
LGNVAAGFNQLTSGLGNTLKGLLPSSLPRTPGGLSALKTEQEDLAASISNQIAANQTVQDEIMPLIAAAQSVGDLDTVDSLYSQLDAVGYTDPSKLTEHLNSINQNIQTIDGLLTIAVAAETPSSTLNVDAIDLGVSPDNVYNVTDNPDLQTQTSIVYENNDGTIPQYYA